MLISVRLFNSITLDYMSVFRPILSSFYYYNSIVELKSEIVMPLEVPFLYMIILVVLRFYLFI